MYQSVESVTDSKCASETDATLYVNLLGLKWIY